MSQGYDVAKALNLTQGDISLCCRGMKHHVGGYKFRFLDENLRPEVVNKKRVAINTDGIAVEEGSVLEARKTRASLLAPPGAVVVPYVNPKICILAPRELKVNTVCWYK